MIRRVLIALVLSTIAALVAHAPAPTVAEEPAGFVWVDAKRRTLDAEWTPQKTRLLEHVAGFDPAAEPTPLGKFGGRLDRQVEATGFFHTRQIEGRWWIVDPQGYLWYSMGCTSVRTMPTPGAAAALEKRFGSHAGWADATARLLRDHGFNSLGCWSDWPAFREATPRLPYTTQLNFMSSYGKLRGGTYQRPGHTGYPNDCIFVFDPAFEEFCLRHAREQLAEVRDDPYLVGHFSDNEMPLRTNALDRYLQLGADDPGYQAARRWADEQGLGDPPAITDAHRQAFLEMLVARYFRIVRHALREATPHHMYLGCRFYGSDQTQPAVWRAARDHVDIVSINYYGAWTPDPARMAMWARESQRPFFVTEWYAKGMDSGLPNVGGAGWTVRTQADRGRFYQNFTLALIEHPACVGWQWFRYQDNDPDHTAADPSNRDANKGIVTNRYEPYPELLGPMRAIHRQAYRLIDRADAARRGR